MKNKILLVAILFLIPFVVFYLCWSFVLMEFDPSMWSQDSRVFYMIMSLPTGIFAGAFSILNDLD